MRDLGNKEVMSQNLQYYIREKGIKPREISQAIDVPYTTVLSWVKGDNYPRIDKIDLLADYFGILKSDLIERKEKPTIQEDDGLSEGQRKLIEFAKTVPEDKAEMILAVMKTIAGAG